MMIEKKGAEESFDNRSFIFFFSVLCLMTGRKREYSTVVLSYQE